MIYYTITCNISYYTIIYYTITHITYHTIRQRLLPLLLLRDLGARRQGCVLIVLCEHITSNSNNNAIYTYIHIFMLRYVYVYIYIYIYYYSTVYCAILYYTIIL